ncbi:MAG: 4-(cytidine 5'-diphospho)-2-C-methyl-D-erythritol kinase [Flavobacteriales bacterium]
MIVFPNAKINLGLNVVRRRDDGYHEIESVMVPVPLTDALEAVVAPELGSGQVAYTRSGLEVPGPTDGDLCMKALDLLRERNELPGLRVHLHKVIPMGAGLGGGSSDGAHMLLLLNDLLQLGHSKAELAEMAATLGSDCPFFLEPGPQLALGRGELLSPISLDLSGLWLTLVTPGIHVPTPLVYKHTVPTGHRLGLEQVLAAQPIARWQDLVPNTMERYVFEAFPEVERIRTQLKERGALYSAMSGSGSTVFGLFMEDPGPMELRPGWAGWTFRL